MNNDFWDNYYSFNNELIDQIKNKKNINRNDCYLIVWNKSLNDMINQYKNINNYRNCDKDSFSNIEKIFTSIINDFNCAVQNLKDNKLLKLVKKDLIETLNHEKYLSLTLDIDCGNNILIIKFKNSKFGLLILNPIESLIYNDMYSYVILFNTFDSLINLHNYLLNYNLKLNNNNINRLKSSNIVITQTLISIKNINDIFPKKKRIIQNKNLEESFNNNYNSKEKITQNFEELEKDLQISNIKNKNLIEEISENKIIREVKYSPKEKDNDKKKGMI